MMLLLLLALGLPAGAHAYGFSVHELINRAATTHLPPAFAGFAQWADDLETLSVAADQRKCCDPDESRKHYIDIDDYAEFFAGTLPHSYEAMVNAFGQPRVDGNGTLPWAIESAYADLVSHFRNEDWTSVVATAADLGHYVADSHNPMHLTVNYNGQLTGQNGIHSRHESEMTGRHLDELVPAPGTVSLILDPLETVFDNIDALYPGVQAILDADLVARDSAGGSTSSDTYYFWLWYEVGNATKTWIRAASIMLASLWYSAWTEAGSPPLPGDATGVEPVPGELRTRVLAAVPNPFRSSSRLRFELAREGTITLRIVDSLGRLVRRFEPRLLDSGVHQTGWDGTDQAGAKLAGGVYHLVVTDDRGVSAAGRVVLLR